MCVHIFERLRVFVLCFDEIELEVERVRNLGIENGVNRKKAESWSWKVKSLNETVLLPYSKQQHSFPYVSINLSCQVETAMQESEKDSGWILCPDLHTFYSLNFLSYVTLSVTYKDIVGGETLTNPTNESENGRDDLVEADFAELKDKVLFFLQQESIILVVS